MSPQSARLAACVGTNLNNDGILLHEAMAVLFVAQVYGIELTLGQRLFTVASFVFAGIGIAVIPTPDWTRWRSYWRPKDCPSRSFPSCSR